MPRRSLLCNMQWQAAQTLKEEMDLAVEAVRALAAVSDAMGAAISSGSFKTRGMIVIPCSVRTLAMSLMAAVTR